MYLANPLGEFVAPRDTDLSTVEPYVGGREAFGPVVFSVTSM